MVMFGKILIIILAAAGLLFPTGTLVKHSVFNIRPSPYYLKIGDSKLGIEIVDTDATRARGLSGRPALDDGRGMLFVFDRADYHGFWMKDMRFPIDIIWFNDDWRVIDITENISPEDFPKIYRPRSPVRYVLEINAGFTAANKIILGDTARIEDNRWL